MLTRSPSTVRTTFWPSRPSRRPVKWRRPSVAVVPSETSSPAKRSKSCGRRSGRERPGDETSSVNGPSMGSSSSIAAEIHSVSAVTSSSEMGPASSSAWSMRTRTHGFFFEPTTSTSTMSMPCSGAAASSASRMRWRVSCSGTAGMSPPSHITGTYRKEAGRETPPHFLRITTALQIEYRDFSAGGQGAGRTASQGRHGVSGTATRAAQELSKSPEGPFCMQSPR